MHEGLSHLPFYLSASLVYCEMGLQWLSRDTILGYFVHFGPKAYGDSMIFHR